MESSQKVEKILIQKKKNICIVIVPQGQTPTPVRQGTNKEAYIDYLWKNKRFKN